MGEINLDVILPVNVTIETLLLEFTNNRSSLPGSGLQKETPTQVFSCEFCQISKNTFFHRIPLVAASVTSFRGEINPIVNVPVKLGLYQ